MVTPYYSTSDLGQNVLSRASNDELLALTRIFNEKAQVPKSSKDLTAEICMAGGHAVANWLRSQGVAYSELLHDVASMLKVDGVEPLDEVTASGLSVADMDKRAFSAAVTANVTRTWHCPLDNYMLHHEQAIVRKFMADSYQRMTPAQRAEVDRKVHEIAETLLGSGIKGLSASAAFLVVANAGGFATYMLMSTVISTLTVGIASFGVYTAAASVLHVLLGPPGWAALGLTAVYKLGGPNKQQCVKAVLALAMLRCRLSE